jgi:hypothetical protein
MRGGIEKSGVVIVGSIDAVMRYIIVCDENQFIVR